MAVFDWAQMQNLSSEQIEKNVAEILDKMTLDQKLNQLKADWSVLIQGIGMGIRYNYKPIPAGEDKQLGIPPVLFTDGPRGIVMGNSTCFPVSMARGATWDPELEEKVGNVIGIEAKAQGANFFAGVCINCLRHPAWGRAQETYGEDPYLLGAMGVGLINGVQRHVMACAKHYACNSMENARFKVNVKIDERTLQEVYLWHFKKCVDAGVASIMSAYNKVNGEFCGHNSHLLRDILKKEWNFPGFVMSDFMLGIRNGRKALLGGLDIEMPFKFHMRVSKMRKLVKSGQVPESLVDDGVRRILREKLRFNRTSDPQMYTKEKIACIEHRQLALEVAQKSLVLLKNEAHVLPLDKTQVKKLALIGRLVKEPNIGDHGSSKVHPSKIITVLEGCQTLVGDQIEIIADTGKNLDQAKRFAQDADAVVIVIGYTHKDEGEYLNPAVGGDRISIRLHAPDVKLIQELSKVNKRCVVVLEGGSAIITDEWNAQIPAILMAWYPGMEGGTAIAQTLFGLNNPSGKLPCIFPKSEEQLPFFDRDAKEITYEYYHGYKLLDKNKSEPRYAFGYGLSYTTFSLKQIEIDKAAYTENDTILIRAEIENTGQHTGAEVVQTYVGYEKSALDRPVKDLRGFKRVHLKPGEKKRIEIPILIKDLAYYDPQEKCWRIEKMDYSLYVGTSSRMEDLKQFRFKIQ